MFCMYLATNTELCRMQKLQRQHQHSARFEVLMAEVSSLAVWIGKYRVSISLLPSSSKSISPRICGSLILNYLTFRRKVPRPCEMWVTIYQKTWCHIPEYFNVQIFSSFRRMLLFHRGDIGKCKWWSSIPIFTVWECTGWAELGHSWFQRVVLEHGEGKAVGPAGEEPHGVPHYTISILMNQDTHYKAFILHPQSDAFIQNVCLE